MNRIDYTDSQEVYKFASETVEFANQYAESRKRHAAARAFLNAELAKKYRDGKINQKAAYAKALIFLTEDDEECREQYQVLIAEEGIYKGWEKVLEARQSKISLAQSLIKNQMINTN